MSADIGDHADRGLSSREAAEIVTAAVRAHADQAVETADSAAALVTDTPLPEVCRHVDTDAEYAGYDTEPAARIVLLADVLGIDNNLALRRRLQADPWLLGQLGLDAIPSATTLWRIRTKRFEDVFYTELRAAARTVARRCREHGLDADGPPEQSRPDAGDGRLGTASQTVAEADRLTDAASREVYPELSLDRDDNTAIPDTGFWELASFLSTQADSHANAGAQRYLTESRQTTPLGDNFRAQLSALSVDEQRAQLQSAAANLVWEARAEGHLDREVPVAVDTTTGPRFWGDRADHEDTILGTKAPDGQYAYHYATLQIVDEDAPIILDARPVERGEARDEIVADLLDGALGTVTPSVLLMDREFDTEGVRGVCERRDVPYLTPGRRTGEQGRIERLAAGGVDVYREPHGSFADRTREVLYERAESDDVETTISADETEQTRQSELWDELEATLDVDVRESDRDDRDVWSGLGDILDEDDQQDSGDEQATYYLWKTNVSLPEDDEAALNRVKRLYAKRWRIESAYQSLKQFLIPTTSKSQELRFWYFSFASLLYSVWRLVNVILRERVGADEERPVVPAEMVVSFVRRATGTG